MLCLVGQRGGDEDDHLTAMAESKLEPTQSSIPKEHERINNREKQCQEQAKQQQQQQLLAPESAGLSSPQEAHEHHAEQGCGNKELEFAVRKALEGPEKDLGRLCKILGEAFCLPSPVASARAANYDSGSDTTSPADQDHSSSESGNFSEPGGDVIPQPAAGQAGSCGGRNRAKDFEDGDVRAVAAAAKLLYTLSDPDLSAETQNTALLQNTAINLVQKMSINLYYVPFPPCPRLTPKIPADLLSSAWNALFSWRSVMREGDLLDVYNSTEGEWYLSKLVPLEPGDECELELGPAPMDVDGGVGGGGEEKAQSAEAALATTRRVFVRIHYQGWPVKYDETFRRDSASLQPAHTHTKRPKKAERKKRAKEVIEWVREDEFGNIVARGIVGQDDPYHPDKTNEKTPEREEHGATVNRFGRKVVPRVSLAQAHCKGKAGGSDIGGGAENGGGVGKEGEGGSKADDSGAGRTGKKRTNRFVADGGGAANSADDWICATCTQFDTPCMSDMVTCDGPCLRSFHVVCLDVDEEALSQEKWFCEDCERGQHVCWQCGDEGQDNVMGGVFRCSGNMCGRFYHRHCVELNTNSLIKADLDEGDDGHPVFKFRCGYHTCDTCSAKSGSTKKINHLYRCFKCPTSYHINCIPPDARYHELALLCGDHPEDNLPALKQEDSVLGDNWAKGGDGSDSGKEAPASLALQNLKLPKVPPKAEHKSDVRHFRLPLSILNSYNSKPPPFQHICAMHFIAPRPPRVDPTPVCNCTGDSCDESCLNAMLKTECVCGNGIRGRYQNCKQGANCGNRRLQNRVVAKVAPFREAGMGWGLKIAEDVSKGSLVGEYVGEVIDEATVEHRMSEQRRLRPNDGEFYIMELGQSLFVDAKEKGNLMRLINHSCDPNCDVQAWNIAGYTRLGIYASKDLVKGESLSYDYKFSTNETARFKCMCGAANCRGTLAPKVREDESTEDGSKLKGRARREMLQKRERIAKNRQARSHLGQMVTWKRLSLTSKVLPGDKTAEVKAGPPPKYFGFARDQGIFLVRNARTGADLLTRKRLLETKARVDAKRIALAGPSVHAPLACQRPHPASGGRRRAKSLTNSAGREKSEVEKTASRTSMNFAPPTAALVWRGTPGADPEALLEKAASPKIGGLDGAL